MIFHPKLSITAKEHATVMGGGEKIQWELDIYLEHNGSNQTLDLGRTEALLLALLHWQRSLDNVLSDIVILGEVEQFADL